MQYSPLVTDAGLAIASSGRQVKGAGGGGFSSGFVGFGPWGQVTLSHGEVSGSLELGLVSYAVSRLDVNDPLPSTGRTTLDGGTTITARLAAGYRHSFGDAGEGPALGARLGLFFEQHSASNDLQNPLTNQPEGLFPSQTIAGLEARVEGELPVGNAGNGPLVLRAMLGAIPVSQWTESPSGSTGTSPTADVAPEWAAGVLWAATDRWKVSLDYRGEIRTASFSGPMTAGTNGNSLNPPVTNAKVTETLNSAFLSIRRSF